MIQVKCPGQNLIGDALAAVPFITHLCKKHRTVAVLTDGFNVPVRELIPDHPFIYHGPTTYPVDAVYTLNIQDAWQMNFRARWPWHMGQMYFAHAGEPVPDLPLTYPMRAVNPGLLPGIVLSPFSRTNSPDNNKLWPHDHWVQVLNQFVLTPAYVVGTSADDFSAYEGLPQVWCLRDRPLPEILYLLRHASVALTLDNGIGHLCHFGGVYRHVMIYADCLPPLLAENPLGIHIRGRRPIDITPVQVMHGIQQAILRREAA
jgi:hypothetical protein